MSDTLSFLHAVLPAAGPYVVASIGSYTTHLIANTITEVEQLGWAQTTRNRDAYFLIGSVNDGTITKGLRAATNICALRALRVDLDCGEGKPHPDQATAAAALMELMRKNWLPQAWVVTSGYGFHVYWPLEDELDVTAWQHLADRSYLYLKDVCQLQVDHTTTCDAARILRIPGTYNFKRGQQAPVTVQLVGGRSLPSAVWHNVFTQGGVTTNPPPRSKKKAAGTTAKKTLLLAQLNAALSIPAEAGPIFEHCAQLRRARDQAAIIDEPMWYAALGVAAFVDPGMVRLVSEGHPDYDPGQTEAKVEQWRQSASGPTTCARFNYLNPQGCAGCPHVGVITSPIQLGKLAVVPTPQPAAPEPAATPTEGEAPPTQSTAAPVMPAFQVGDRKLAAAELLNHGIQVAREAGIMIQKDGVWGTKRDPMTNEEVAIPICRVAPVVILAAQQVGAKFYVAMAYKIDWVSGDYAVRVSCVGDLVGQNATKVWAEQFMVAVSPAIIQTVFVSWATLLARKPVCDLVSRHGYVGDGIDRFVVGDALYTATGESLAVHLKDTGDMQVSSYKRGELQPWVKAATAYAVPGAEVFACTVLASFASPLVKLVGEHTPAALYIEGITGRGKTTATRLAAAVWMSPTEAESGGNSTVAGMRLRATDLNALPLIIDESRSTNHKATRNFLYDVSNGSARTVGTPGQQSITTESFCLLTMITSNTPASSFFFDPSEPTNRNTEEGIAARVVPLRVTDATARAPDVLMPYLSYNSMRSNYGHAGAVFMKHVLARPIEVERMFKERHAYVKLALQNEGIAGMGERAAVTIAVILTAGEITNQLGLTIYDLDRLRSYLLTAFASWVALRAIEYTSHTDVFEAVVDQEQRNINVVESIGLLARTAVANSIVIYNNHAYLAEQTVMRIAGKMQLSSEEVRAQAKARGFIRESVVWLGSRIYYKAPAGVYVARAPQKEHT